MSERSANDLLCGQQRGAPCALYGAIFRQGQHMSLLVDADTAQILDANDAACAFYGYSREELTQKQLDALNPLPLEVLQEKIRQVQQESSGFFCFRHYLASGEVRDVEVSTGPVSFQGKTCLLSFVRDVSRRNRAETALRARAVVTAAILGAQREAELLDEVCRALTDQAGYRMAWFGYALNNVEKTIEVAALSSVAETFVADRRFSWDPHRPGGKGLCGQAVRSGKPVIIRNVAQEPLDDACREGAREAEVASLLALPLNAGSRPLGVLLLGAELPGAFDEQAVAELVSMMDTVVLGLDALRLRDHQKRLEQRLIWEKNDLLQVQKELERTVEQLESAQAQMIAQEKLASIGQLAAGVAHEINNPTGFVGSNLASLGRYVGRLRQYLEAQDRALEASQEVPGRVELQALRRELKIDVLLDDLSDLIVESQDGVGRIQAIVRNLKSFARTGDATMAPNDLHNCLESTINIVWNELKYKAELVRAYGDLPPVVCNPQQINQVFMNLLVNAAHAIEEKGTITLRTWVEQGRAQVAVHDTGCGISPENLGRVFEPFFTTKAAGKGTGLGMSIAADIVQKHNGTIRVDSQVGQGTVVTISLPLDRGLLDG